MKNIFVLSVLLSVLAASSGASNIQNQPSSSPDPATLLSRTKDAMGFNKVNGGVIHSKWIKAEEHPYESDRTYPPFFSMMTQGESWFDPVSGVERDSAQVMFPGAGPNPPSTTIYNSSDQFFLRENSKPVPSTLGNDRNLNAWFVISAWTNAKDVRYGGREMFRDYPRDVLLRTTPAGEQRLLLDAKTAYPVKLEFEEPHYLWGQRKLQYVFSNWQQSGAIFSANSAFRIADNEVELSMTTGDVATEVRSSAPSLDMPEAPTQPPDPVPLFLRPTQPKVIDVSPKTKILSNPGYSEAVTLVGDEVYIFDATQGEQRARLDHELIHTIFPSAKKFNVVVTDLAWPHVAGLRYWVTQGATIISHQAARPFLEQVLARRWTRAPDAYEKTRNKAHFNFVGVEASQKLVSGKISIHPIDGIGSEVALMAYMEDDRFLWASDYIQTLTTPTMYAAEVIQAVRKSGLQPERVAAEHLKITEWQTVLDAQELKDQK